MSGILCCPVLEKHPLLQKKSESYVKTQLWKINKNIHQIDNFTRHCQCFLVWSKDPTTYGEHCERKIPFVCILQPSTNKANYIYRTNVDLSIFCTIPRHRTHTWIAVLLGKTGEKMSGKTYQQLRNVWYCCDAGFLCIRSPLLCQSAPSRVLGRTISLFLLDRGA